jgi:hypothetical protein
VESDEGNAEVRLTVDVRFSLILHDFLRDFVPIVAFADADLLEMNFCEALRPCMDFKTNARCRVEEFKVDKVCHG